MIFLPFCQKCGAEVAEEVKFCSRCGSPIGAETAKLRPSEMVIVTTPSIPGYHVVHIFGVVTGLTARTRGVGGKKSSDRRSQLLGLKRVIQLKEKRKRWFSFRSPLACFICYLYI